MHSLHLDHLFKQPRFDSLYRGTGVIGETGFAQAFAEPHSQEWAKKGEDDMKGAAGLQSDRLGSFPSAQSLQLSVSFGWNPQSLRELNLKIRVCAPRNQVFSGQDRSQAREKKAETEKRNRKHFKISTVTYNNQVFTTSKQAPKTPHPRPPKKRKNGWRTRQRPGSIEKH